MYYLQYTMAEEKKEFFVYLLQCTDGNTYVGATIDINRRLRQHNKEIKGGAIYTGSKVSQGQEWSRICYVSGFPLWNTALQFEWRWKQLTRKMTDDSYDKKSRMWKRRMKALYALLQLEQATTKAIPYCDWTVSPNVTFSDEHLEKDEYFTGLF